MLSLRLGIGKGLTFFLEAFFEVGVKSMRYGGSCRFVLGFGYCKGLWVFGWFMVV